jgi:PadR family transcriptional regulator AphA
MATRNRTKYTILGMLAIGSMTGYEIIKTMQSSTNYFWSESEGQIYPALAWCVKEKLATCKEQPATKSNRHKKIYSITTKGRNELIAWLKKTPQKTTIRNELLLKIFFGANVNQTENIHHIIQKQKQSESELIALNQLRDKIARTHKNSMHLKYWLITLDLGIKHAKSELSWCKDSLKILNED